MKRIFMIAGPNGSGKTTIAKSLIPDLPMVYEFLNADEIAKGLAPLHPEKMSLTASKLMINRLKELLKAKKSFAFETTAAGTNFLKHLITAKEQNYEINLMFLWLLNPDQAIRRVEQRVAQGGHDIPKDVIKRRYVSGIRNLLQSYLSIADTALIVDNSLDEGGRLIARKNLGNSLEIHNKTVWEEMQKVAHG